MFIHELWWCVTFLVLSVMQAYYVPGTFSFNINQNYLCHQKYLSKLMDIILKDLSNEYYSLYSRVSIPILWQDPFSFGKNPLFISKYFSSLDEGKKLVLKEYGINEEFPKTLFNYARFLKVLDLFSLKNMVIKWADFQPVKCYDPLICHIISSLLELFIDVGAILHQLDISEFIELKPEILHLLERNEKIFSQLQKFSLQVPTTAVDNVESVITLLEILAKHSTKISAFKLTKFYTNCKPQVFQTLIRIVKSQAQLRQIKIVGGYFIRTDFHGIFSALESQKQSLREVEIENCSGNSELEVLKNCENLEILRMRRIDYCENVHIAKILKSSHCKLKTLEIVDFLLDTSIITQILEKFGSSLQRLELVSESLEIQDDSLLLKNIKFLCPNITFLSISYIKFSTQLIKLIGNLQKLQFLTLSCEVDSFPEEVLKVQLKRFAESVPLTLQYLDTSSWLDSYIDIWLNNCNAPLKKLIICSLDNEKQVKALIEFCKQKRTLNYVGITNRYYNLDYNFKKPLEKYVKLVPSEWIIVNC